MWFLKLELIKYYLTFSVLVCNTHSQFQHNRLWAHHRQNNSGLEPEAQRHMDRLNCYSVTTKCVFSTTQLMLLMYQCQWPEQVYVTRYLRPKIMHKLEKCIISATWLNSLIFVAINLMDIVQYSSKFTTHIIFFFLSVNNVSINATDLGQK